MSDEQEAFDEPEVEAVEQEVEQESPDWRDKVNWEDLEAEARSHGWDPKGVPGRPFVDPGTFLERFNTVNATKKAQEKMERRLAEVQKQTAQLLSEQSEATRKRALDEAEKKHRRAVEEGDVNAAALAAGEIAEAKARQVPDPQAELKQRNDKAVEQFAKRHPMLMTDESKFAEAERLYAQKMNEIGVDDAEEILPWVEEQLEKQVSTPHAAPAVETQAKPKAARTRKVTAADIPQEYRAIARRFVETGAFKSLDEYAQSLAKAGDI